MPLIETKGSGSAFAYGLNSFSPDFGAMVPLQYVTASGSSTTLAFTNIPQTYKHLILKWFIRTAYTAEDTLYVYNYDGTGQNTNSTYHYFGSDGSSTPVRGSGTGGFSSVLGYVPGANQTAGVYGAGTMTIHNYSTTSRQKTVTGWGGWDGNNAGRVSYFGNTPLAASGSGAISALTLLTNSNIQTGSYGILYGVKG